MTIYLSNRGGGHIRLVVTDSTNVPGQWGVVTLDTIPPETEVIAYVGEVITQQEADRREVVGPLTYTYRPTY